MRGLLVPAMVMMMTGIALGVPAAGVGSNPAASQDAIWDPDFRLTTNTFGEWCYWAEQKRVAPGPDGRIHVTWYARAVTADSFEVHYMRFNPGVGWSNDTVISTDLATNQNKYPSIAVDSANVVYVIWASLNGSNSAICYKSCAPAGNGNGGWDNVATVLSTAGPTVGKDCPTVAATPDGHVHASWVESSTTIKYRERIGGTWQSEVAPVSDNYYKVYPVIAGSRDNNVHLTYHGRVATSGNYHVWYVARVGGAWNGREDVSQNTAHQMYPSICCDPVTYVPHIVWRGYANPGGGTDYRVIYSNRSGGAWSPGDTLSEYGSLISQGPPQLAFTADGLGHVVWTGQYSSMSKTELLYRERNTSGVWQPYVMLTNGSGNREYASIAGDAGSNVHVLWLDSRSTPAEMYYKHGAPDVIRDVGVTTINFPGATVDSGTLVNPMITVHNYGSMPEMFTARMQIGSVYDQTASPLMPVAPGSDEQIFFSSWIPTQRGVFGIRCSTQLAGDQNPANDTATGEVDVRVTDVAPGVIIVPQGSVNVGDTVHPQVSVNNYGSFAASVPVRVVIFDSVASVVFDTTEMTVPVGPGGSVNLWFNGFWIPAHAGRFTIVARTQLQWDQHPENDSAGGSVRALSFEPGWHSRRPMPLEPSMKPVKDGAWLAYHAGNGMVYAAKGNKTNDFYLWDPGRDTWTTLETIPPGPLGRMPRKGCAGCSDGNRFIYMVKGNNTNEFYRYDVPNRVWQPLDDVPMLPSGKRVKGGGDLVYAEGREGASVYLLKGFQNDFLRYDVARESWFIMPSAPSPNAPKWPAGSWLANDGSDAILAHKGRYSELWTYSTAADSWFTEMRPGIPIDDGNGSRKKAKDGSAGFVLDSTLFALKGGNTLQFWALDIASGQWQQLESMPIRGTGTRPKRVKGGGDITGYIGADRPDVPMSLPAVKGNGTTETYTYDTKKSTIKSRPGGTMVQGRLPIDDCRLSIAPNPFVGGFLTLNCNLPIGTRASVNVYDALGRSVLRSSSGIRHSTLSLDARSLPAGVYIVRLDAAGRSATRKLVVRR